MLTIKSITKVEIIDSKYVIDYNDNLYSIDNNGETIAYATFRIDDDVMWLDMIEVIVKGKGLGRMIIDFFFQYFSLNKIKGLILCEKDAYHFWNKIGAEIYYIDVEGYGIDELLESGLESPFVLNG